MASTDVDSTLKMKLPNNDVLIQSFELSRDAELAKGSNADHEKLLQLIEVISVLFLGGVAGVHRVKQRERAHKANDTHEILIGSHRNWKAKALQSVGGSIGVAGAVFLAAIVIGATFAGVPPAGIQTVITWASGGLTMATQGFSSLGSAAQSGDQADINKYDHAVNNEKTERNDDQSTNQAVEGQKTESMRRMKEAQQQKSAAWSTAASASR